MSLLFFRMLLFSGVTQKQQHVETAWPRFNV